MRLPSVQYSDRISKYRQIKFNGLNHNLGAGDGALWDMQNMTGDCYPLLAVRAPRFLYGNLSNPGGIFAWNELCWVTDGRFYYNGIEKGELTLGTKSFAAIGAIIVIFPDKCYYDVQTDSFGSLEAQWIGTELTFCDGVLYEEAAVANCIKAEGVDWAEYFNVGDSIIISGCTVQSANNKTDIIRAINGDELYFYEQAFALSEGEDSYTENGELQIIRTVPDLHYVCEQDNRLWGCSENTIYCSKPGDPFNWNVYEGLDSDAWAVTPASPGAFTGCVSYGNYPIMFKEDHLYKIYGSLPSSFSCVDSATSGLEQGSSNSLAIAGETLFYLSRNGIVAYSGGIPQPVAAAFGQKRFKNGVAASDGQKYYISMQDEQEVWGLYVYDTQIGNWYKEDDSHITHFARIGRCIYMLNDKGEIWITGPETDIPQDAEKETGIAWMAETTDFTESDPNKKHTGKVQLRMDLDEGSTAQVWMQFDSDGIWNRVGNSMGESIKRSYYLPIKPHRCDHYRIRITGTGGCRIHSITREVAPGSEHTNKNGRH